MQSEAFSREQKTERRAPGLALMRSALKVSRVAMCTWWNVPGVCLKARRSGAVLFGRELCEWACRVVVATGQDNEVHVKEGRQDNEVQFTVFFT